MMTSNLPQKPDVFVDDGRTDRSKESFQGTVFKRLDQTGKVPISFFRSDFRKAKFENCIFRGNDFSRCDFVASVVRNTDFYQCSFLTSSIISSILSYCRFENNKNFSSDLFRCRLSHCELVDQEIARATWRDTAFISCRFTNCSIERSTFQNIEFIDCNLDGLDLSRAAVYDVDFTNSSVRGATIDPDYLGTYTFNNIDPSSLHFSYRSFHLDLSLGRLDDFAALVKHFERQQRWSEAFNVFALIAQLHRGQNNASIIEGEWKRCLLCSLDLEIPAEAGENIRRLCRLARHYLSLGLISVSGALDLIASVEVAGRGSFNALVLEELSAGTNVLRRALELLPNIEEALAIDQLGAKPIRFQVQIAMEDESVATENFTKILDTLSVEHGIPYQIIRVGYGSVLIEAVSWFLLVVMFFRVARSISYSLVEIRLIFKVGDRLTELVDRADKPKEILDTLQHLRRTSPKAFTATDSAAHDIKRLGKTFRSLLHDVKVGGVEFLALVREVRIFVEDLRK